VFLPYIANIPFAAGLKRILDQPLCFRKIMAFGSLKTNVQQCRWYCAVRSAIQRLSVYTFAADNETENFICGKITSVLDGHIFLCGYYTSKIPRRHLHLIGDIRISQAVIHPSVGGTIIAVIFQMYEFSVSAL